jgi:small redox-active disulfide protein 2
MALFGFGKKKEEVNTGCDCGGACEPKAPVKEENGCCCGGNCNSDTMAEAETAKKEGASVKVLGSGCAKCNQLEAATKEALIKLGMEDTIDHVTDFSQIAAYGVMTTPALVVDGKVVSFGKVLKTEEVIKILQKVRG